jgi:DNA modification methylase
VAGHGRWLAAKRMGLSEVPVIRAEFLTDADRRAFALAENRIAQLSGWDEDLLSQELSFLLESGCALDITGFTTADLKFALPDDKPVETPEPIYPSVAAVDAVSRPGDLWRIGPHQLMCGDSRDVAACEALFGTERARIVFADCPYNVPIHGHVCGNGRTRHREFMMASGEMTRPEFTAFLRAIFRNCVLFSVSGAIHYHSMDFRHIREMLDAADGIYDQFKQLIVWDKGQGGQGSFYRSAHELIFVFKAGKGRHINNFGLGAKGRNRTNVVHYPGGSGFRKGRARDLADHSTVKPIALVADFLLDCSNPGDLAFDPCAGSGTTLIAAHKTGRRGAAIEIDPGYVDTALRRLTEATGLPIRHADGRSFADVASERGKGEAIHG